MSSSYQFRNNEIDGMALTSIAPGRNLVVLESTCVSTIAKNMCQPNPSRKKEIGNSKSMNDFVQQDLQNSKNECCTESIVKGKLVVTPKIVKSTDHNA
jgi:hypothetical protein